jgi:TatA/E family protein of Tat protein translocase
MGPLGWPETIFIVLLALLLFGPKKLPELGRTLGKAITEFRRASSELKTTFDREMRNLERETEGLKEVAESHYQDSYNYDYSSYDTGTPYSPDQPSHEGAPALSEPAPHAEITAGASADQGAESTASKPGLTVTPATGIIANGTWNEDHAHTSGPAVTAEAEKPAQEISKS